MGNENSIPELKALSFYDDADAAELFARIDFKLKDGYHFQAWEHDFQAFDFIHRNEAALRLYYEKYFGVVLAAGGTGSERYYYLEFNPSERGEIDGDHRYFLRPEYVIVGFMIYKIIYIDRHMELTSVKKLQGVILNDYEELQNDLYRLLAKLRRTNVTAFGAGKVNEIIVDALREFRKLGWVTLEEDYFDVLPSFQRLGKIYGDHINNIDDLIRNES